MRAITHNSFFASTSIGTKTRKAEAGRLWLALALLLALVMVLPLQAQAQNNYVYVNNQAAANTVSAYSVSSSGSLTQLPGYTGGALGGLNYLPRGACLFTHGLGYLLGCFAHVRGGLNDL